MAIHPLSDWLQKLFFLSFWFLSNQNSSFNCLLLLIRLCGSVLYPFKHFIIAILYLIIPLPEVLEDLNLVYVVSADSRMVTYVMCLMTFGCELIFIYLMLFLEIMPAQIWGEFPPEVVWICFCQKISGPNELGLLYPLWESWINVRAAGSLSPLFAAGPQGNVSFSIYTVPLTLSLLSTLVSVLGCLFSREKKSLRHLLHYIMSTFRKLYLYPGSSCFLKRNVFCHFARNRNHIRPSKLPLLNLYTHWTIILLHAKLCIYT